MKMSYTGTALKAGAARKKCCIQTNEAARKQMLYPHKRGSTETTLYANKELLSARRVTVATKEKREAGT